MNRVPAPVNVIAGELSTGAKAEHLPRMGRYRMRDQEPSELRSATSVYRAEWEDVRKRRDWHGISAILDRGDRLLADGASALEAGGAPVSPSHRAPDEPRRPPSNLTGLALSGGGIRSATFCLGVLQGLKSLNLLAAFDYLSTVSGGGFVGGWWSAWLARPPLLNANEVNWEPLLAHLTARGDPLAERLSDAFSESTRELLSQWESGDCDPPEQLRAAVLRELNAILCGGVEQCRKLFAAPVKLSPRTRGRARRPWPDPQDQIRINRLILQDAFPGAIAPKEIFPGDEEIEPQRAANYRQPRLAESSLSAWEDPTHHLRLFANYLTPRKGLLSGDTWRAAAVIGRNMLLTWLILLPVLCAIVTAGRLWFVHQPGAQWRLNDRPPTDPRTFPIPSHDVPGDLPGQRPAIISARIAWASAPLIAIAGYAGGLTLLWLWNGRRRRRRLDGLAIGLGAVAVMLFTICAVQVFFPEVRIFSSKAADYWREEMRELFRGAAAVPLCASLGAWLALFVIGWFWVYHRGKSPVLLSDAESRRFRATRMQSWLLVSAVVWTAAMLVVGFGAEIMAGLTDSRVWVAVKWSSVGTAVAGAAFSALRSAPTGGADRRQFSEPSLLTRVLLSLVPPLVLAVLTILAAWGCDWFLNKVVTGLAVHGREIVRAASVAIYTGVALSLTYCAFELIHRIGNGTDFAWVIVAAVVVVLVLAGTMAADLHISHSPVRKLSDSESLTELAVALAVFATIFVCTGWVLAVGWVVDPNLVSLHEYYRSRLVRAYLGASNPWRGEGGAQITEAAPGDDVLLRELNRGEWGAPVHLVNATLNLVAGRDLATAQRSAASFVLSRRYCGSVRTGFRRTADYMGGQLTLGTALALSGAAASPNMGSRTPTAAVAMLMTLMNVRLGYWAPTPNRGFWREPQARLWPFYIIKEFLSQTNDLGSYCYLSDGGHFDNTGLYSLIERGCRYLVVVDCGADPKPCFEDLGNVIRRCRIDFGAEITLDISRLIPPTPAKSKGSHRRAPEAVHVIGSVTYSKEHMARLGYAAGASRTGIIVWIKPSLALTPRFLAAAADVRQYGLENRSFPQQTTLDQWFDEAQFESYRQLGVQCVRAAFGEEPRGKLKWSGDVALLFEELASKAAMPDGDSPE